MPDRVGQQFGGYRLIELIQRGSFCEVFVGEHVRVGVRRAVKVFAVSLHDQAERERFEQEIAALSRLVHPHIARIYDWGVDGETPWLAMEYAPNGNLRQLMGGTLDLSVVVACIRQAADALHYTHGNQVVHQRVTPENLLLYSTGGVLLADFALRSLVHPAHPLDARYLSPEQAAGQLAVPASDQYALAVVVYEWLSGHPPFAGTADELRAHHQNSALPPLAVGAAQEPAIFDVLNAVLGEKDPQKRSIKLKPRAFATALYRAAFAQVPTLRYVDAPGGTPVPPLPPPSGAITALAWSPDDKFIACGRANHTVEVWEAGSKRKLFTYHEHVGEIRAVAWSPDGAVLASADAQGLRVWEVATELVVFARRGLLPLEAMAWSPNGGYMACIEGKQLVIWEVPVWLPKHTKSLPNPTLRIPPGTPLPVALAWAPDNLHVASAAGDVRIWNRNNVTPNGQHPPTLVVPPPLTQPLGNTGLADVPQGISWKPDGKRLAIGYAGGSIAVWAPTGRQPAATYPGHRSGLEAVAWAPDGKRIAAQSKAGGTFIHDAGNGAVMSTYPDGHGPLAWSHDGKYLASGGAGDEMHIWQV